MATRNCAIGFTFAALLAAANPTWGVEEATESVVTAEATTTAEAASPEISTSQIAEESAPPLAISWGVTFASTYLFQGIDYSEGLPVVQPQLALDARGFTALLWMNYDIETEVFNEYDIYLQRGWDVGELSVSPGYAYLRYPHRLDWEPTHEALVDAAYDAPLAPTLSFHYDFGAGDGSYTTLGVSQSLPGSWDVLSFGSKLFYQNNYYAVTGVPAWEVNAAVTFEFPAAAIQLASSYFTTWENGDFTGDAAVPSNWLVSMNFVSDF